MNGIRLLPFSFLILSHDDAPHVFRPGLPSAMFLWIFFIQ
ncbi:hypothetical protein D3OALGB2SA_1803 [Olavius algarvensis associated proteobacterium Delta 3]|nr:hypothetical protein D3OALGB2SA_1803 [Olavius algarvensis associated proteobacterium Delta 3]